MHAVQHGLARPLEVSIALLGLAIAAPVLAAAAAAIRLTSRGPILFRQQRIGRAGQVFEFRKLRTMALDNAGPGVTASDDARVTAVGRILRKSKLDELPALWHVVRGEMSLVGYRPELPRYVDQSDPLWRAVLQARPGLTDPSALDLRNEEELLAAIGGDREQYYLRALQPYKLIASLEYLQSRSWMSDVRILFTTVLVVALPARFPPPSMGEIERRVAAYRGSASARALDRNATVEM